MRPLAKCTGRPNLAFCGASSATSPPSGGCRGQSTLLVCRVMRCSGVARAARRAARQIAGPYCCVRCPDPSVTSVAHFWPPRQRCRNSDRDTRPQPAAPSRRSDPRNRSRPRTPAGGNHLGPLSEVKSDRRTDIIPGFAGGFPRNSQVMLGIFVAKVSRQVWPRSCV
jgi:hypothetical protein